MVVTDAADTPQCQGNCRCWVTPLDMQTLRVYDPSIEPIYPIENMIAAYVAGQLPILLRTGIAATSSARQFLQSLGKPKRWELNPPRSKLQHEYSHAPSFGIEGNPNNKTLEDFKRALQKHIDSPNIKVIKGEYRGRSVTHYFDPKTKLNIIRDSAGKLEGAWKLSEKQIMHLIKDGKIGGGK